MHCHSVDGSTIEDVDLTNLLSAYSKHVGNRSTDAHRELMKRDPMVNDISFSFKKTRNVHCHSVDGSTIEDIDLTNLLSAYSKHVGSRSTDRHHNLNSSEKKGPKLKQWMT